MQVFVLELQHYAAAARPHCVKVAALGVFGYASFSIIAGCLGDYRKPPNLVVMVTGIISIVQVPIPSLIMLHH